MDTKREEVKINEPFEAAIYKLQPKAGDILILKSEWVTEESMVDFKKAMAAGGYDKIAIVAIENDEDLYLLDEEQRQKLLAHLTPAIPKE